MNERTLLPGDHLHVISGCSSSGKSTLLAALAALGENVSPEPVRRMVQDELAGRRDGVPWQNPRRFMDLCGAKAIAEFDRHVGQPRRTFDRSFIDVASGVVRSGLRFPAGLNAALQTRSTHRSCSCRRRGRPSAPDAQPAPPPAAVDGARPAT
jgi:predicted ATPase